MINVKIQLPMGTDLSQLVSIVIITIKEGKNLAIVLQWMVPLWLVERDPPS